MKFNSLLLLGLLSACGAAQQPGMNVPAQPLVARVPPSETSDESNQELLGLAREQGRAFEKALGYMMAQQAASGGSEKRGGDYLVAYAVEFAEGFFEPHGDSLQYTTKVEQSMEVNAHVEIVVRDGYDGRFVPELTVTATLIDSDGRVVGTKLEPFMWHPWLYHYGENWRLPHSGRYTLRVHIDAPRFRRHDIKNGQRYAAPVDVEFQGVEIKTGAK